MVSSTSTASLVVLRGIRFVSTKILSRDRNTIICLHPKKEPLYTESRPLKPYKHFINTKKTLTPQQVEMVQKLRAEDPSVWTVNTLASLFNVRRGDIRKFAPASKERQAVLDEERKALIGLPLRKRRQILMRREETRQQKLKLYLSKLDYKFPAMNSNN